MKPRKQWRKRSLRANFEDLDMSAGYVLNRSYRPGPNSPSKDRWPHSVFCGRVVRIQRSLHAQRQARVIPVISPHGLVHLLKHRPSDVSITMG